MKGIAALLLFIVGVLCFAEVIDIEGRMIAVVEFYQQSEPAIVSWNFPGTSASPTIIPTGDFVSEVYVTMDSDTEVDMFASKAWVDSSTIPFAVYWDFTKAPGKVYIGSVGTATGQQHYIKFSIVFKRTSTGATTTLTVEGYVKALGGIEDVAGHFYLNQYDLTTYFQTGYEVLRVPVGAVTLKFVASKGAQYVGSVVFKIWKQQLGIPVENYYDYYPTPDWTITLNKASTDTWSSTAWTPTAGTYVMYGYLTVSNQQYRQLSVLATLGDGGFGLNQIVGLAFILSGTAITLWRRKT